MTSTPPSQPDAYDAYSSATGVFTLVNGGEGKTHIVAKVVIGAADAGYTKAEL